MSRGFDIHCTYHGKEFRQLASVLETSVRDNCPNAELHFQEIEPAREISGLPPNAADNLWKLTHWWPRAMNADRPFVCLDADTLVVNDLTPVWAQDFDIAYSIRPHRCPIIGGVIFGRPTQGARQFFTRWLAQATQNALSPDADTLMSRYGGLLQSALNKLRETPLSGVNTLELDAETWNCCDQVWHRFDAGRTRVIHLKGRLRRECFKGRVPGDGAPNADLAPLVDQYVQYLLG